jgi:hypothetical protein
MTRWANNIKIDIQEIEWGVRWEMDWSGSGLGQVAGSCAYDNEPSGSIICGEFLLGAKPLASEEVLCSMELVD